MSSFKLCSDEDLEAIFHHWDFHTQCKFRRCSRRWNHLLRSPTFLHTVVFTLSAKPGMTDSKAALDVLQSAVPYIVQIALIATDSSYKNLDHITFSAIYTLIRHPMPVQQHHHERRLYLCNFDARLDFLEGVYKRTTFDWVVLINMTLPGTFVRSTLIGMLSEQILYDHPSSHPVYQVDPVGMAGLAVRLSGRYVLKSPVDVIGVHSTPYTGAAHIMARSAVAVMFGWIKENMRHLSRKETREMLGRLLGCTDVDHAAEEQIQAAFVWLLRV